MIKKHAIKIVRGETQSRLPLWFWANLVCFNLAKNGVWFWRKGDELMWLYPWARKHYEGRKFLSLLATGTGQFGDAAFYSLKELDSYWKKVESAFGQINETHQPNL